MEKIEYPKWKYHATKDPIIVESKLEDDALGPEWVNSPADMPKVEQKAQPKRRKSEPTGDQAS